MFRLPRPPHALPILAATLAITLAPAPPPAALAAPRHRPSAETGDPVTLAQQPGGALDQAARALNAHDLAAAARRGDTPVVLVGSAPLSAHAGDTALFVQLQSADLCGSAGCATSVYLRRDRRDWVKVLDSISGPIALSRHSHGGMRDLIVDRTDRWVWNGTTYRDTMPAASDTGLRQSIERFQARRRTEPPPR
ncbi:hypothetical protein ACLRDC_06750 [Gluconacetobacter sacchari]|uniref:Lipoprotein n=2 Tax=Gluconacetobacter sacchari TaxID=92759 RepID=A0A7W4IDN4_9PROT|nr:hypothetical protein [Gluconacetobacter sacchari]MBB2160938.1 hypothetical protein [Gluconacetobacter sacchari]GBQ30408.1 hypothetical protein AA12717_3494 [Gluconacetobacter sacchari DSM 12717]